MQSVRPDVVGEKCVRNDHGTLAFTDTAKKEAWRSHYNRLLNEEFAWDKELLTIANAISGPALLRNSHTNFIIPPPCLRSSRWALGLTTYPISSSQKTVFQALPLIIN